MTMVQAGAGGISVEVRKPAVQVKVLTVIFDHGVECSLWLINGRKRSMVARGTRTEMLEKKERIERFFSDLSRVAQVSSFHELCVRSSSL